MSKYTKALKFHMTRASIMHVEGTRTHSEACLHSYKYQRSQAQETVRQMSLKFTKHREPKMTVSSIRPVEEKKEKHKRTKEPPAEGSGYGFLLRTRAGGGEGVYKYSMPGRFM